MTRQRLRPAYSPVELADLYAEPFDHARWHEHTLRIGVTSALARWLVGHAGLASAADLMCGDGAVLDALADLIPAESHRRWYGDLTVGPNALDVIGPIEETAQTMPSVDLAVLTEALEHLDDPDLVLKLLRAKAKRLILSTPVDAWNDTNPEHYWAWSRADVEEMLRSVGWVVEIYQELDLRPGGGLYSFGLWAAS